MVKLVIQSGDVGVEFVNCLLVCVNSVFNGLLIDRAIQLLGQQFGQMRIIDQLFNDGNDRLVNVLGVQVSAVRAVLTIDLQPMLTGVEMVIGILFVGALFLLSGRVTIEPTTTAGTLDQS